MLDASVVLAWALDDETSDYADAVQDAMVAGEAAIAPGHLALEVANAMLVAERRGRFDPAATDAFLEKLDEVPIQIDGMSVDVIRGAVLRLAREHRLAAYGAAYLELAQRRAAPLATLDDKLVRAARRGGIDLWVPLAD